MRPSTSLDRRRKKMKEEEEEEENFGLPRFTA
jgi:hypothetical protein